MGSARGASLAAVLPVAALKALAARLPESAADVLALPHVTRANYDKYGAELLKITSGYAVEKIGNISPLHVHSFILTSPMNES